MKRFAIQREIDPTMTWQEMDAAAIQNVMNWFSNGDVTALPSMAGVHGARWVRSYWSTGAPWTVCLYEARDLDTVERWQSEFSLPYTRIDEIEETEGSSVNGGYFRGFHAEPPGLPLLAVVGPACAVEALSNEGQSNWIRSYRAADGDLAIGLFKRGGLSEEPANGCRVHPVVEVEPADYLGWD